LDVPEREREREIEREREMILAPKGTHPAVIGEGAVLAHIDETKLDYHRVGDFVTSFASSTGHTSFILRIESDTSALCVMFWSNSSAR
jgi:hypothetical protein